MGSLSSVVNLSDVGEVGRRTLGKIENEANKNDDLGSHTLSGAIETGLKIHSAVRTAQNISPIVVNAVKTTSGSIEKVGKGTWEVCSFAGRLTLTVAKTTGYIKTGLIPFNSHALYLFKMQARISKLDSTLIARRIISRVKLIKKRIDDFKNNVANTVNTTKRVINDTYRIIRIFAKGRMTARIANSLLEKVKNRTVTGIKVIAKGSLKIGTQGGKWVLHKGIPKAYQLGKKASISIYSHTSDALKKTDDYALQGVGHTLSGAKNIVKTAVKARKVVKSGVKTSAKIGKKTVNTGKKVWRRYRFITNKGLSAAYRMVRKIIVKVVVWAAKAVAKLVMKIVAIIGLKLSIIIAILLVIIVVIAIIVCLFTGPLSSITSVFTGVFSISEDGNSYSDHDIREYLSDTTKGIPLLRENYINHLETELSGYLIENGGDYHYVRIYKNGDSETIIDCTNEEINSAFYSSVHIMNIVQPIFNSIIAMDYELSPSEEEAQELMEDIFNSLFSEEYASSVEYCGQLEDDTISTCAECGKIHADTSTCPNIVTGNHSSYTCSSCCYYEKDVQGKTIHKCNGYQYCGGHKILVVTLNMDGIYELLHKYFTGPIDDLSNLDSRTNEQEKRLQDLKDYYHLCLELIREVGLAYGGGLTMQDLSGVVWVNGSRIGNQAIVDLALSQVGQMGGQPYWSWYGFEKRVEWCACFVSWCLYQSGYSEPQFASCHYGGVPYFKSYGQWASGGFTDLAPGDIIFFDWECDGISNHVGLVIGTDGTNVYTVEGNSGDVCRIQSYPLNSSVIYGYGLVNY